VSGWVRRDRSEKGGAVASGSRRCLGQPCQLLGRRFRSQFSAPRNGLELSPRLLTMYSRPLNDESTRPPETSTKSPLCALAGATAHRSARSSERIAIPPIWFGPIDRRSDAHAGALLGITCVLVGVDRTLATGVCTALLEKQSQKPVKCGQQPRTAPRWCPIGGPHG
jgi:hypothetical protein